MFGRLPLTSLLIKPAGPDCNLSCGYCFYLPKAELFPASKRHRMDEKVLEETMRQGLEQCAGGLSLSWQGGEPSLMGQEFYKKAVKFQKQYGKGKSVSNAFQTNGVLMNSKWSKFFGKYNFLVGLSLDGPENIHDHYRQFNSGKGSWKKVTQGAKALLKEGVPVNALSCLTDHSVNFPKEIYQFHKSMGFRYMQFIPVVERGAEGEKLAPFSVTGEQYGEFMCRIFDLWLADFSGGRPTTSVRLFESLFFSLLGRPNPQCTFRQDCGEYLVVEHNGDVYPCDFFVDTKWRLGNVMEDSLVELLNSERQAAFRAMKRELPEKCKDCQFLRHCHGGCPKDRAFGEEAPSLNTFCAAYTRFFEYAMPTLKNLAARWR